VNKTNEPTKNAELPNGVDKDGRKVVDTINGVPIYADGSIGGVTGAIFS
jgi:hypothetical protein